MNAMRSIRIEKVTLNIGVGEAGEKLDKACKILERISKRKIIKTKTNKRIPSWNVRPGLLIGCKTTLRGKFAVEQFKRMLAAVENKLKPSNFDQCGNVSFGIKEYIDIPEEEYDPVVGLVGLNVCVTLERPGYRVKKRKIRAKKIGRKHIITQNEAIQFMKEKFGVKVE